MQFHSQSDHHDSKWFTAWCLAHIIHRKLHISWMSTTHFLEPSMNQPPFPEIISQFLKNKPVYFKAIKCETDTIYGFNLARNVQVLLISECSHANENPVIMFPPEYQKEVPFPSKGSTIY